MFSSRSTSLLASNTNICVFYECTVGLYVCICIDICEFVSVGMYLCVRACVSCLIPRGWTHPESQFCLPQDLAGGSIDSTWPSHSCDKHPHPSNPFTSTQCPASPLEFYTIIKRRVSKLGGRKPQRQRLLLYEAGHFPAVTQWDWKISRLNPLAVCKVFFIHRLPNLLTRYFIF